MGLIESLEEETRIPLSSCNRREACRLARIAREAIIAGYRVTRVNSDMIRLDGGRSVIPVNHRDARKKGGHAGAESLASSNRMMRLGDVT